MIQTLPYSTLLRYVYNELPASALPEVEEALQHDPELATACADLLLAQRTLTAYATSLARRYRHASCNTRARSRPAVRPQYFTPPLPFQALR